MRILLLDKNAGIRSSINNAIKDLSDIVIDSPPDVMDAINKVKSRTYDIIISEYDGLGDYSGYNFLERIRLEKLTSWSTSFIILTTKEEKSKDIEKILGAGELHIDAYLYKPFTAAFISERVLEVIKKKNFLKVIYDLIYKESYDQAIDICKKLKIDLKLGGKKSDVYKGYAKDIIQLELICYIKKGDYELIKKLYRETGEDPSSKMIAETGWFSYFYAKALYFLGNYAEAEKISVMVKEKFPNYMDNYELLADICYAERREEEAIGILKQAVGISPNNIKKQQLLGQMALYSGDLETAQTAFQMVISKGERSPVYSLDDHVHLAHTFCQNGDYDMALKTIGNGCGKFAKDNLPLSKFVTAVMESQIYAKKGDQIQSKSAFDFAIHTYKENPILQLSGENSFGLSDNIKLYFGAECLEHGEINLGKQMIVAGTQQMERKDVIQKHLGKVLRGEETTQIFEKIIEKIGNEGKKASDMVSSGNWKGAIAFLTQQIYDEPNNPFAYFDLVKVKIRYMSKNLSILSKSDIEIDKQLLEVNNLIQKGKGYISQENKEKTDHDLKNIDLMLTDLMNKIKKEKEKSKKITPEMLTGDDKLDDILPDIVLGGK